MYIRRDFMKPILIVLPLGVTKNWINRALGDRIRIWTGKTKAVQQPWGKSILA